MTVIREQLPLKWHDEPTRKKPDNTAHKELCKLAGKWLRNYRKCNFVISELVSMTNEIPDAIGWKHGYSHLIECKTSRADFLRDKKKSFKKDGKGMGDFRYYLCPDGMIKLEELPEGWQLLYAKGKRIVPIRISGEYYYDEILQKEGLKHLKDNRAESALLCSVIRRLRSKCEYIGTRFI